MKIELASLCRSRAFRGTLLLFVILNAVSWWRFRFSPAGSDGQSSVGFPFPAYIRDDFESTSTFYLYGLLLDIAVALTVALLVTWIAALWQRYAGRKQR